MSITSSQRRNHIVRRQRPPNSLQHKLTYRLDLHDILDLHQHSRANEDLPRLGLIAKTRGNIRYGPDGGVIEPPLEPNGAKRSEAVRNADAK